MKKLIVFGLCIAMYGHVLGSEQWKLRKENDNMKIYTATVENSNFKSVRVECTVKGRFSQIIAVLFDIDKQKEWVFNDKYSKLLKRVQNNELIYYSEVNLPWPCTNRDFIAHLAVTQSRPDVVNIRSFAEPGFVPENNGIVRIKSSSATWILTATNDSVKIDYVVAFNPGGAVPAWLSNMFIVKGPFETFRQLQSRMDLPAYKNARFDFIKD